MSVIPQDTKPQVMHVSQTPAEKLRRCAISMLRELVRQYPQEALDAVLREILDKRK